MNSGANKPHGGLWLSPAHDGGSDWAAYLEECPPPTAYYFSFIDIDPAAQFLCIDSLGEFYDVLDQYSTVGTDRFKLKVLDFERIAEDYAGIYLTHRGQKETRYPSPEKPILSVVSLYGWDIESVLVLQREAIVNVTAPFLYEFMAEDNFD